MLTGERILEALRIDWPAVDLATEPQPVTGGQWATIRRLHLTGTPDGVPEDLVLRVAPHAEMAAKEQAVQSGAADSGIPTPRIHLTCTAGGPLRDAWALMDTAPGTPLLASLDGTAALAHLPWILARLPRQLADTMARIHSLDPDPVADRVRRGAPAAAFTLDELWPHLHAGAVAANRPDLVSALGRLADTQPAQSSPVLCHGDLHPLNLIADGDRLTVLDWTAAIVAPAAYDVANTRLLLRHPPLPTPSVLRPALAAGAAVLARRFAHRYERANPTADLTHLDWYTALHAARILLDHATWTHTGDPRAHDHPWHLVAPAAARTLSRTTRIDIQQP